MSHGGSIRFLRNFDQNSDIINQSEWHNLVPFRRSQRVLSWQVLSGAYVQRVADWYG